MSDNHMIEEIYVNISLQNLTIKELPIFPGTNFSEKSSVTFIQLKSRLMNLLINALQVETDPQNTHMLLGKLTRVEDCYRWRLPVI